MIFGTGSKLCLDTHTQCFYSTSVCSNNSFANALLSLVNASHWYLVLPQNIIFDAQANAYFMLDCLNGGFVKVISGLVSAAGEMHSVEWLWTFVMFICNIQSWQTQTTIYNNFIFHTIHKNIDYPRSFAWETVSFVLDIPHMPVCFVTIKLDEVKYPSPLLTCKLWIWSQLDDIYFQVQEKDHACALLLCCADMTTKSKPSVIYFYQGQLRAWNCS